MTENSMIVNLCNQRTGSKFLGSCLRAGADVVPLGELFNPDSGQALTFWSWLEVSGRQAFGNRISVSMLDRFFEGLYTQFGPFYFDLMYNQMSALTPSWTDQFGLFILRYLRERKAHVIHTMRDPGDIFTSLKKLEKTGVAHARSGVEQVDLASLEPLLGSEDFRNFRENYFQWRDAVNQAFAGYERFFSLDFDHLVARGDYLPEDLLHFLSAAVRHAGQEYGDHVQIRGSMFGKAPQIITATGDSAPDPAPVQVALVAPDLSPDTTPESPLPEQASPQEVP